MSLKVNMENRKKDLYNKHEYIIAECEKISSYINLTTKKSENSLITMEKLNEHDFLKNVTNMYNYLNQLHENLMNVSCIFDLFYIDFEKYEYDICIFNNKRKRSIDPVRLTNSYDLLLQDNMNQYSVNKQELEICTITSEIAVENLPKYSDECINSKLDGTVNDSTNDNQCILKNNQNPLFNAKCITKIINNEKHILSEQDKSKMKELMPENCSQINTGTENPEENEKYEETIKSDILENQLHVNKMDNVAQIITVESQAENAIQFDEKQESAKDADRCMKTINSAVITIIPFPDPKEGDLCCIGYVDSPSLFYIQVVSESTACIDLIPEQIEECIDNLSNYITKTEAIENMNRNCVYYCETSSRWHRAEVVDWLSDTDNYVKVQLVDYGCTLEVPLKCLRETTNSLCVLPKLAIKCQLASWATTLNEQSENIDFKWNEHSLNYFNSVMKTPTHQFFTISFVERIGDSLSVDLQTDEISSLIGSMYCLNIGGVKNNTDNGAIPKCITKNYDMITEGAKATTSDFSLTSSSSDHSLTKFMKEQIKACQGFEQEEEFLNEDERLSKSLYLDDMEEHENANMAVSHYDPIDEQQVCKFLNKSGGCFKGTDCKWSHQQLNPDGWTTDRNAVYFTTYNNIELPERGTISVNVIHIKDLRTLYVSLKSPQASYLSPGNSLKTLVKVMNNPNEVKTLQRPLVMPAISQLILVQYDKTWQRGKVIDVVEHCDNVDIEVFMVDFGDTVTVDMKDIRDIKDVYLHLPFQAILCFLCNVELKPDLSVEQMQMGLDYLEMCSFHKILKAKILYSSTHLGILLYDQDGFDVGKQLIEANLVNECKDIMIPKPNYIYID